MRAIKAITVLVALSFAIVGCSQQYRTADAGLDEAQVVELLDDLMQNAVGKGMDGQVALDLREDPYSSMFVGMSGPMGHAHSLMSFTDMGPYVDYQVFNDGSTISVFDIQPVITEVDVMFWDAVHSNGARYYILMTKIYYEDGGTTYHYMMSDPNGAKWDNERVEITMRDDAGQTVIVRTNDVDDEYAETFASAVKLNLSVLLPTGEESYLGQFATLAGYGGLQ